MKQKYNLDIDRESAYEILTKKIDRADKEGREKARKKEEKLRTTTSKRRQTNQAGPQKAIVKLLTSATFIRGVMGVLNKL